MRVLRRHGKPALVGAALLCFDGRGAGADRRVAGSPGCRRRRGGQARHRRHRLDADLDRARPDDDDPGAGAVLRRHGPQDERAGDGDAELRDHLPRHRPMDGDRLQHRLHAGDPVFRRAQPVHAGRHGDRFGQRTGQDDPRIGLHDVPDDVRDHHAGADLRRLRRPHEVFRADVVHRAVVGAGLLRRSRTGSGGRTGFSPAPGSSISPAARWFTSTPASPG